ncbi:MAG: polyphosphate glucokinase [Candidatus Sumerlaeota bacterium]|nr:polyphosphate glucokinase [Candidatus Sumerlaeota bacterium]
MQVLGIDIGGSGIKGAPVETTTGELQDERFRVKTPSPSTPKAVVNAVDEVARHFSWKGPIGIGFPGVVRRGVIGTAANLDNSWEGQNAEEAIARKTGCPVVIVNDADAAGLAEVKFGGGGSEPGVVIVVTIGTGIGTAVVSNGAVVPNTELGHMFNSKGVDWELLVSEAAKKREDLKWAEWVKRLNAYLKDLCFFMNPDRIIIGGGVSRKFEKYGSDICCEVPVVPAQLRNLAGIIGAALYAEQRLGAQVPA